MKALLFVCKDCGGFVPNGSTGCPNCEATPATPGSRMGRAAKACLRLATGGAVAMTLMACYGGPPHAYGPVTAPPEPCENGGAEAPYGASSPGSPSDPHRNCSGGPPTSTIATGSPHPGPAPEPGPPGS